MFDVSQDLVQARDLDGLHGVEVDGTEGIVGRTVRDIVVEFHVEHRIRFDDGRGFRFSFREGHALVPEVGIYFGGHLLRGNRTTKQSAEEFNAFESFNYPHLVEAGVNITYYHDRMLKPDWSKPMAPHFRMDNNVIIFSLFPGIREDLIRHIIHTPNLKAIVMRTFGSGNAPQRPWLLNALREGTRNGKVIVNISQCMQGAVEMGRYDNGYHLQEAGVISGRDSTVEAAVTKLMFLQAHYPDDPETVRKYMQQSIRGEISF